MKKLAASLLVVVMIATACGGASSPDEVGAAVDEVVATAVPAATELPALAPDPTATVETSPTPEPTATAVPEPTPTPNPDLDGDGVLNDDDDFPNDAERSAMLVSQFPLVDGVNQLPEDEPSVQALRVIQSLVLADESDPAVIDAVMSPDFFGPIGFDRLDATIVDVRSRAAGVWEVVDVRAVTQWWLWVQMGDPANLSKGTQLVQIGIDPNTDLINEMSIQNWAIGLTTQQYPADQVKDLETVFAELSDKTQFVGLLLADVTNDGCSTILGHEENTRLGTASVYKQWVLGAAAAEIEAGRVGRDDPVTFAPGEYMANGSLSTGQFAGVVELTLQQAANLMMNRSDNGATDMVERAIGRQAAWDFVDVSGHTEPDALNPILGVRDYDHMYSSVTQSQVDAYVAGTEQEQQAFVLEVLEPLGATPSFVNGNSDAREFSWQASPVDVCETMATMRARFPANTDAGGFIDQAFGGEAFLFGVRNEWDRVWYKGGGIPGQTAGTNVVYTHATMVESNDGRSHALIAMFNAEQGFALDPLQFEVASLLSRIHQLMAAGL